VAEASAKEVKKVAEKELQKPYIKLLVRRSCLPRSWVLEDILGGGVGRAFSHLLHVRAS
jgi:hypothetical protein